MSTSLSRIAGAVVLAAAFLPAGPASAADPVWPDLKAAFFEDRPIEDGSSFLRIEAPYRAHDAATVPVEIVSSLPGDDPRRIKALTLIIDENPAPLAAVFTFAEPIGPGSIGTRVRINAYTPVHVVAEATDGTLYQAETFIKASGGCSAPAMKSPDEALAGMGQMRLRSLAEGGAGDVELLIRHPNFSGMQMDPVTRHYTPARYIETVAVSFNGRPVLNVEGNISLSENPAITFAFTPNETGEMTVHAVDSKGTAFDHAWPLGPDDKAS
ncbi:quinoprotein dehydrogenase-associated SoxYZ-like carrier [Marinivivus vitaminiproducens]|uniref:quinoprotein dehydrogenase-associated SoxYZ-like carrier n=1 Tax=Marinivivus vitaminiproducens TaxID=3035935 RepID=UPI0027995643|nr:quinoprotein dehydrogenase-associated SoxYZ-like carrier [Geminicoccaceae bacterium SCSIO 64248]